MALSVLYDPHVRRSIVLVSVVFLTSCGGAPDAGDPVEPTATPDGVPTCEPTGEAPNPLPGIEGSELDLDYWLARAEAAHLDLDAPILDEPAIAAHDAAVGGGDDELPFARRALSTLPTREVLEPAVDERIALVHDRLESGAQVQGDGSRFEDGTLALLLSPMPALSPSIRITTAPVALRCAPLPFAFFTAPTGGAAIDPAFDRNACSTVERQEAVQVLASYPNGMALVRSRYALGWLSNEDLATLSPALADVAQIAAWTAGARARALSSFEASSLDGARITLGPEVLNPLDPHDATRILFADATGVHRSEPLPAGVLEATRRPLTRRAFLTEAFRHLGAPYGWGGMGGGLDCSELVMDVLSTFELDMPRNSARQAEAGSFSIPVAETMSEAQRLALLDRALAQGIVLMHFPGHVMIYLGRDAEGEPRILHSFAEYLEPCVPGNAESGERLMHVNRVSVSGLELGRDTSRRAFIQRLTRIAVLGPVPDGDLGAPIEPRTAAPFVAPEGACSDSIETRIVTSPAQPYAGHRLRVIVTANERHGAARLQLIAPDGTLVVPERRRLGGPPYAEWVEVERPMAGRWTIGYADGTHVAACDRVGVMRHPPEPEVREPTPAAPPLAGWTPGSLTVPGAPPAEPAAPAALFPSVWEPRWRWEADTEALYAAFVEQLFSFPVGDERTWSSLSELLRDPAHNLLFDHLGLNEEAVPDTRLPFDARVGLELVPDCADLPYFLRAYFAWKLRLPFGYHRCSRGRAGSPPTCGEWVTNATPHSFRNEVVAFQAFATRNLASGVHSASGRTAPDDDATDLYPVPLTREALRPGTVFADPYGHLLVLVQWVAPSVEDDGTPRSGILLGADAQPDGTIGRRTFWRGTFLFTPDTTDVGAGFKAFRPVVYDSREGTYVTLLNDEIRRAGHTPWSRDQYRGTTDDFYDAMESLIDPRPLDPEARLIALVDALEESTVRRVVSIDNGEDWFRAHPGGVIPMPEGIDIFLTEGPWEDFSTPSRDMRLLIAIDTVMGFPDAVRRRPERFHLPPGETLEQAITRLESRRDALLAERHFRYTRSDGSSAELTLSDLIARTPAIEIAWNPNDCPEVRWGAVSGSSEASTCRRRAPVEQVTAMGEMRAWFHGRARPVR